MSLLLKIECVNYKLKLLHSSMLLLLQVGKTVIMKPAINYTRNTFCGTRVSVPLLQCVA